MHDIFTTLRDRGYISTESRQQPYCETDRRFLPDRYVEGTCPTCSYASARGDQCERCGELRDPQELVDWRCRLCGQPPILRESEHFFLRLSAFREMLIPWVKAAQGRWRANVHGFTLNWITEELKDRPITRDIEWGVPVPLPGYDNKRIYVWFEAVIGYLSAAQEWAQRQGRPDAWREFWQDPDCKSYYFMGKDNIAFHTIIWPAMLMGYGAYDADAAQGAYNLPYDVPANEFVTLQGRKISTSQNWVIWVPDFLERHPPDPLRYYFSANMPESADANFSWSEYVRRNNDELVATYGNLVHRVMTLLHRYFEGRVPEPGPLDDVDNTLLQRADETLQQVGHSLSVCRFREAIGRAMALAADANRYLDRKAPWRTAKEAPEVAATTLWTTFCAISTLKTVLAPFLPFSSATLHTMGGFPGVLEEAGWTTQRPQPGQVLGAPVPLFVKIDEGVVAEEEKRLLALSGR